MQQNAAPLALGCTMVNLHVLFRSPSIDNLYTKFGGKDIG